MAYRCPGCGQVAEEPHQFLAHLSRKPECKKVSIRPIRHYEIQPEVESQRATAEEQRRQGSQMAYA